MNGIEIEVEILKSKIQTLENQIQFLNSNWVGWTTSTKDIGQKLIIALEQRVNV